jgi:hypothetical protein
METPFRPIPDPLRNVDVDERTVNKPIRQTAPTVVNKRKYAASTLSASLSLSSSSPSSTPSSPASNVDRRAVSLTDRTFFTHRPRQLAKRPRLDLPAGRSSVIIPSRQALAPPPVFRRRPPTPFNRCPGETSVAAGGQGEGLEHAERSGDDTDDSLNLSVSRLR